MNDNSIPADYKQKVKIFSVKIKKKEIEQKPKEEQKKVEETREFNGKREEKAESIAQQEIAAQGAVANNGVIELQLQGNIIRINKTKNTIEINGEEYKIPSFELRAIINRKDNIIAVSKKEKKIIIAYDNGVTSEIGIIS
jgi:hypothetical protein